MLSGTDGTIDVEVIDRIAIIRMNRGENRINDDFTRNMMEALDKVERNKDIELLITTGNGKFYSNGLDLDWMNHVRAHNDDGDARIIALKLNFRKLYLRLVTFPVMTVAAINGHAFAAGGLLTLAHDYRVMSKDRGWWCMNEVYTRVRVFRMPPLMQMKLPRSTVLESLFFGTRYPAEHALKKGLVDHICQGDKLIGQTVDFAKSMLERGVPTRENLQGMKHRVYGEEIEKNMMANL